MNVCTYTCFVLLSGVCQLSVLLVTVMEVFCSPLCSSWATLYLWIYVIKHYITAVKEMVDQTVSSFFYYISGSKNYRNSKRRLSLLFLTTRNSPTELGLPLVQVYVTSLASY